MDSIGSLAVAKMAIPEIALEISMAMSMRWVTRESRRSKAEDATCSITPQGKVKVSCVAFGSRPCCIVQGPIRAPTRPATLKTIRADTGTSL